jgi:hypothetical protein
MPIINDDELSQLRMLSMSQRGFFLNEPSVKTIWQSLIDKAAVWPPDDDGLLQISKYGERILAFYDAVKAGQVKTTLAQCQGCQNPC